jgi:acyl carrier protein
MNKNLIFNETEKRVVEVLENLLDESLGDVDVSLEDNISKFGINSINFMKVIVALEIEFDIEIEVEEIDPKKLQVVSDIARYVKERVQRRDN